MQLGELLQWNNWPDKKAEPGPRKKRKTKKRPVKAYKRRQLIHDRISYTLN